MKLLYMDLGVLILRKIHSTGVDTMGISLKNPIKWGKDPLDGRDKCIELAFYTDIIFARPFWISLLRCLEDSR